MKVKEMRQILSKYEDDDEVYIDMLNDDEYETDNIWLSNVREPVAINNERRVKEMKIAQRACKHTAGAKKCLIL